MAAGDLVAEPLEGLVVVVARGGVLAAGRGRVVVGTVGGVEGDDLAAAGGEVELHGGAVRNVVPVDDTGPGRDRTAAPCGAHKTLEEIDLLARDPFGSTMRVQSWIQLACG